MREITHRPLEQRRKGGLQCVDSGHSEASVVQLPSKQGTGALAGHFCIVTALHSAGSFTHSPLAQRVLFYVLASGSNYGVAYSMVCCHFMEMQWKHAVCMHDGEYFHGPFETTDKSLPMVLLMDEGRTRALDERCLTFLKTYAENYIVIDFQAINKGRIDHAVAEFFSPVVMVPVERFYVSQMAIATGHSMDYRRYMWKVSY